MQGLVITIAVLGSIGLSLYGVYEFWWNVVDYSTLPDDRCKLGDSCWPSREEWDAFNQTVDGRLISVKPIG